MKNCLQLSAGLAAIAAGFLAGCSTPLQITDRTDPTRPSSVQVTEGYDTFGRKWEVLRREVFVLLSYTGTITDIDYANREVTLKNSQGQLESFAVDKRVQRFNEAKVGDKVSMDYYLGYNAEVRNPTPEEQQNPLVVLDAAGKAGPASDPAAFEVRRVRAVVTIEALNKQAETVTVKTSRGKYHTLRVADPSRLDKVRVGQTILVTFTQAAAIALKPAN